MEVRIKSCNGVVEYLTQNKVYKAYGITEAYEVAEQARNDFLGLY